MIWAEFGACEGSVEYAFTAAKYCQVYGAALKVQWFDPDTLVTRTAPRYDGGEGTQYESFSQVLPYSAWRQVVTYCTVDNNIGFIPSVFDMAAIDTAVDLGVSTLKIASADITYKQLIQYAAQNCDTLAISTGGANEREVMEAVNWVEAAPGRTPILYVLACHLQYPTPLERASIHRIEQLFGMLDGGSDELKVGFSDHTAGTDTIPVAVGAGAWVIEKHCMIYDHRADAEGDDRFALSPDELKRAVELERNARAMVGPPQFHLTPDDSELPAIRGARRSLIANRDIEAGQVVYPSDIAILRPGTGMRPDELDRLFANGPRRATRDIPQDSPVQPEDFTVG